MAEPIKLSNNLSDAGKSGSSASNSSSNSTSSVKIDLGAPTGNIALSGNAGNGNSGGMGNIFTQSQAKKDDSKMITSVISQKEIAQKTRSILGPAPTLEKSIEKEKEASAKRKLRLYQFVFLTLFVASGAMVFYFYSQLSPDFSYFGANVTQNVH